MGGYVTLPAALGVDEAKRWVKSSLAYVSALAPRKKKKP